MPMKLLNAARRHYTVGLVCLLTACGSLASAAVAHDGDLTNNAPDEATLPLIDRVNGAMGLLDSQLAALDLAGMDRAMVTQVEVDTGRERFTLHLWPHSVRANNYQVYHVGADGRMTVVAPGPIKTMRGFVQGQPGSDVAASIMSDGLHAMITDPDGHRRWLGPVVPDIAGAPEGLHVLYHGEDVLDRPGTCGVEHDMIPAMPEGDGGRVAGGPDQPYCIAELACDADYQYFLDWGDNTESRINAVINAVNSQYEDEVTIVHEITTILVRTSPGTYSTSDPEDLLAQFRNQWNQNHGDIPRDIAHLFTGRELFGTTIGIAYQGVVCTNSAYSLVQSDCCGTFSCATDLSAHELGHNWNAFHCSCPNHTMNPSLVCANQFFSSSISSISNFRNNRACLDCAPFCFAGTVSADEYISNVSFSAIDNDSGPSTYTNFTDISTTIEKSLDYEMQITLGNPSSNDIGGVWIDWNNDGDVDDTGEEILNFDGAGPYVGTISVPIDAVEGETFMRVRIHDGFATPSMNPCGLAAFGEVEDYGITIDPVPSAPTNDNCENALPLASGSFSFTNISATTDGPPVPGSCGFPDDQIEVDVWYRFFALCTGTATADVCNSNFDTRIAVYGPDCPDGPGELIVCDDDGCGMQSVVSFPVEEGNFYLVRIGGFAGDQGSGLLTLICEEEVATCDGDLNGDDVVDVEDLLDLLADWGGSGPGDINGDGTIDVEDLLALLANWGDCV
jgi:hypothetical protein